MNHSAFLNFFVSGFLAGFRIRLALIKRWPENYFSEKRQKAFFLL